jgi:hypothetical protein
MDLSSERSADEDRIMDRPLYRAGQTPPAAKTSPAPARTAVKPTLPPPKNPYLSGPKPSSGPKNEPSRAKRILLWLVLLGVGYYLLYGTPTQKKRALQGLGIAAWMLLLGGISYCICLPDLAEIAKEQRAVWEDPNLTFEQKREKTREITANLSRDQMRKVREIGGKERSREGNKQLHDSGFFKMSLKDQIEYAKKDADERRQRWQRRRPRDGGPRGGGGPGDGGVAAGGGGGGGRGGAGGGGVAGGGRGGVGGAGGAGGGRGGAGGAGGGAGMARGGGGPGGGPGGFGGFGGPGGGRGGGNFGKTRLDMTDPESRAARSFMRSVAGPGGFGGGPPPIRR